jgi:hypothetical protein
VIGETTLDALVQGLPVVQQLQRLEERLLDGYRVTLLAICLELPVVLAWCDGVDAEGRAVLLVGRHQLGVSDDARAVVAHTLAALKSGTVPAGVHRVAYAPKASTFIAEVAAGQSLEVLGDGPRGSGKTQAVPGALAILAELRARAGEKGPLRVLWIHDALVNASVKTGRSLESELWAGLWALRDDRRVAVLAVAGVPMVLGDFVGSQDASAQERLRAECHVVAAEEVVPSLDESGGVAERHYEMALTSARLQPNRRRVALLTTNPGDTDTWPFARFIEGGGRVGCVRIQIPGEDRLTPEEIEAQCSMFRDSPDLEARLGRGEWSALRLGELVSEGFDPAVHVSARRLEPSPDYVLACGWDGGHSPSCVIGQMIGGQVQVYASLNDLKVGVLELIEDQVRPWLIQHAPWAADDPRALVSVIDPSMATGAEATIRVSAERTIRDTLGGRVVKGPQAWPPRREAVLRVLAPRHEGGMVPLAINPTSETTLLRQAFASRWYYAQTPDGRVDRSRPKKPNSPWADVGDAAAYVFGWLRPGAARNARAGPARIIQARTGGDPLGRDRRPVLPADMGGATIIRTNTTWR